MLHPVVIETLVQDRQRHLVEAAQRSHRTHAARAAYRRALRERAGWWLVDRGIRLAASGRRARPSGSLALGR